MAFFSCVGEFIKYTADDNLNSLYWTAVWQPDWDAIIISWRREKFFLFTWSLGRVSWRLNDGRHWPFQSSAVVDINTENLFAICRSDYVGQTILCRASTWQRDVFSCFSLFHSFIHAHPHAVLLFDSVSRINLIGKRLKCYCQLFLFFNAQIQLQLTWISYYRPHHRPLSRCCFPFAYFDDERDEIKTSTVTSRRQCFACWPAILAEGAKRIFFYTFSSSPRHQHHYRQTHNCKKDPHLSDDPTPSSIIVYTSSSVKSLINSQQQLISSSVAPSHSFSFDVWGMCVAEWSETTLRRQQSDDVGGKN